MGFEVAGKFVVISGGSQGLGQSLAKVLVARGADVVIVSRTESKLQHTVQELKDLQVRENQIINYVSADVSKSEESERVFREIEKVPDIVICCAGGATPGLFVEMDGKVLDKHMNIVYNTALHFSHAALKVMTKADVSRKRHLIFCSSVLALFPFIGYGSYAPGKAAIRALADILRQECIPYNIQVANILPGNMKTEGFEEEERTKPEITRKIEGPSDARDPDEVAEKIVKDLQKGRQMIYTDFIGWVLSGLMLGVSPRNWGFFQTIIAIILSIFSPVWHWLIRRDIKQYFSKRNNMERSSQQ
ncbi:hypothetical protein TRICI_004224 [Trichomonascus ciferrii]|uniref:3-ketodihydrosphingosine reductase TSC10 n=1 Tax=Trichomonascus ciferrii TaxID=44093 RepID=A0A642V6I6_9ASCO|nr:hypothetical protein TRICI_004224 [Trichomonascus ciferrii]